MNLEVTPGRVALKSALRGAALPVPGREGGITVLDVRIKTLPPAPLCGASPASPPARPRRERGGAARAAQEDAGCGERARPAKFARSRRIPRGRGCPCGGSVRGEPQPQAGIGRGGRQKLRVKISCAGRGAAGARPAEGGKKKAGGKKSGFLLFGGKRGSAGAAAPRRERPRCGSGP